MKKDAKMSLSEELIMSKIYLIRGKKVMLDRDLAELYGVETRVLNQAVRRNGKRFPYDFMFEMTKEELHDWKSQFVISNSMNMGLRKPPLAFTEQGVAMLSSVLKSDLAIAVNIQIIRVFSRMKELISDHWEILQKLSQLEQKDIEQDEKIILIFDYLKKMEEKRIADEEFQKRKRVGFKQG